MLLLSSSCMAGRELPERYRCQTSWCPPELSGWATYPPRFADIVNHRDLCSSLLHYWYILLFSLTFIGPAATVCSLHACVRAVTPSKERRACGRPEYDCSDDVKPPIIYKVFCHSSPSNMVSNDGILNVRTNISNATKSRPVLMERTSILWTRIFSQACQLQRCRRVFHSVSSNVNRPLTNPGTKVCLSFGTWTFLLTFCANDYSLRSLPIQRIFLPLFTVGISSTQARMRTTFFVGFHFVLDFSCYREHDASLTILCDGK